MDNLFSMMELVFGDMRGLDFSVCSPWSEIPFLAGETVAAYSVVVKFHPANKAAKT